MIDDPDLRDQLLALRGMTMRTGMLHEAQVQQLKLWPLMVLSHSTSSECTFNWEKRELDFEIKTKGRPPEDLQKRFETLDQWCKFLLGDDYLVRVRVRGKVVFRGRRLVKVAPTVTPQYDTENFEKKVWRNNFQKEFNSHLQELDEEE